MLLKESMNNVRTRDFNPKLGFKSLIHKRLIKKFISEMLLIQIILDISYALFSLCIASHVLMFLMDNI